MFHAPGAEIYLKGAEFVFAPFVRDSALHAIISAKDRAERYDLKSRFLLFILHFFFAYILGEKRKGKENNQGRDFKSCLSARSLLCSDE